MRIAITDSWPNLIHSAEREFLRRFVASASRVGHEAIEVITSKDIYNCNPDFVLCTHEFTPKLTKYPTFGIIWSPPNFYKNDTRRVRNIRSYDAYLVGSNQVREYLVDLEFKSNVSKPKSNFPFLPVAPERDFRIRNLRNPRSLAYIGVHWEGARHGDVISSLAHSGKLTVYGPPKSWSHLHSGYGGSIDFDGQQLFDVLSAHGIALCIHKEEHRMADTPSMRLFEAAAAGCVIIADEIPYARRILGDSALYVDLSQPSKKVVKEIQQHVQWISTNPEKANELASEAHKILNRQNSLEQLIWNTCRFFTEVEKYESNKTKEVNTYFSTATIRSFGSKSESVPNPTVDIIVRCGDRNLDYVIRAIESVKAQRAGYFRILLVDYKHREDIREFAQQRQTSNTDIKYLSDVDDSGLRSASLWKGFSEVTAPFFSILDDDDAIMPDHFCNLLFSAIQNPAASFLYCGVVRIEEDGEFIHAPNFNGPGGRQIEENRELKFLDGFSLRRLLMSDNYIQSNAWIARKELLSGSILEDPKLKFAEDIYLYYLLASRTEFVACNCATAYSYWRSKARDNCMLGLQSEAWDECMQRIRLRLNHLTFPRSATFEEILQNQQRLDAMTTKKVAPLKSWLQSFPIYNTLREARRHRRRLRRYAKM